MKLYKSILLIFIFFFNYSFAQGIRVLGNGSSFVVVSEKEAAHLIKGLNDIFDVYFKNNIFFLGSLDLKLLKERIIKVKYVIVDSPLLTQGRLGHRYNVEQNTVFLSKDIFENSGKIENVVLVIHEILGALGYFDEKYEISTLIMASVGIIDEAFKTMSENQKIDFLSTLSQIKINSNVRTRNPSSTKNENTIKISRTGKVLYQSNGGVSEGGGGGDPAAAMVKFLLLYRALQNNIEINFINFIINNLQIETFSNRLNEKTGYYELSICNYSEKSFNKNTLISKVQSDWLIRFSQTCYYDSKGFISFIEKKAHRLMSK